MLIYWHVSNTSQSFTSQAHITFNFMQIGLAVSSRPIPSQFFEFSIFFYWPKYGSKNLLELFLNCFCVFEPRVKKLCCWCKPFGPYDISLTKLVLSSQSHETTISIKSTRRRLPMDITFFDLKAEVSTPSTLAKNDN